MKNISKHNDFIGSIRQVLANSGRISKDESEEAINLIKEYLRESKRAKLKSKGLCLNCRKIEIAYGYPSPIHQSKGDDWLDGLFAKWSCPPKVSFDHREIKINNYSFITISPYICENCTDEVVGLIESGRQRKTELDKQSAREKYANDWAIIKGERKATHAKRYWTLLACYDNAEAKKLRELPYREFLQTNYWKIVRNYVVYKRGYCCELCASKEKLNVHHKVYEHHGEEHHYLDDLILLCHNCHAKFHDKLEEPE